MEKENRELHKRIDRLEPLAEENKDLRQENRELKDKTSVLEAENADMKAEVAKLKAQINSNSRNSSKPPSSDGYKRKPAFPRKKKGKQGGQQGHKGRTLRQVEHPDKSVKHKPGPCDCGHVFGDEELGVAETRQVFDLPQPRLIVTEHLMLEGKCPDCGKWHKGIAPEGVNAPVQYGKGVKALTTLLNVDYRIPFKKIQILFSDLFGYAINASTELYTYLFVHEKRGRLALESEQSILDKLTGWLVHDCWGSYFNFKELRHALCGAHILRELEGLVENEQSKWARVFKTFLMHLFEMPFEERVKRRQQIEARYILICGMGEKSEPPPRKTPGKKGRYKRTKGRNLVERLIREKEAMLAFAFNEEVPFTNTLDERDVRPAKVRLKASNCFRSFEGAEIYARIASFVSTTRKHDRNVFSELCTTFEGHNFITG